MLLASKHDSALIFLLMYKSTVEDTGWSVLCFLYLDFIYLVHSVWKSDRIEALVSEG